MTGRRDFLAGAAALALTIAPGVTLYPMAQAALTSGPASAKNRWGMLIDANRCKADCSACVGACGEENAIGPAHGPAIQAQWIRKVDLRHKGSGRKLSLPVMCQHCAEPPCADVCPTGASFKRADGIVLVDKHRCIGCRYCMLACPYKARSFVHETVTDQAPHAPRGKGTVESCTLCVHRVDAGGTPACVEACVGLGHGAIIFGDLNDPTSEISKRLAEYPSAAIRADLGLDPGVRYQGL
ncbi:MAG: 4Fe-4S ferredoxin [Rhodospirillaceae bacterium]|nr:4Fe-4S ferredoxin [Rhodospirillaceae bacterium]